MTRNGSSSSSNNNSNSNSSSVGMDLLGFSAAANPPKRLLGGAGREWRERETRRHGDTERERERVHTSVAIWKEEWLDAEVEGVWDGGDCGWWERGG